MANPRTVINPFTRHEHRMRRNTKNTKWVTAALSTTATNNVDVEIQTSEHIAQEPVSSSEVKDASLGGHLPPSTTDELGLVPLKSTAVHTNVSQRDAPLSARQLIDFSRLEQTMKEAEANTTPQCSASIEELKSSSKKLWQKQDSKEWYDTDSITYSKYTHAQPRSTEHSTLLYRAAKEIYHTGPKGEGPKLWEASQRPRNHRRADDESFQSTSSEAMARKQNTEPLPSLFSTSPNGVLFPPLRPRITRSQRSGKERDFGSLDLRRDSGFSSSSYEVPVVIDKPVKRVVDTNKPLPPIPQVPPKVQRPKGITSGDARQSTEKETVHTWWKHSPSKAPQPLKSKISHPGPLMVPGEVFTVNIATKCGGIGGPAAAVSLPVTHTGAPLSRPPNIHDKKKEDRWLSPRAFHFPTLHLSPSKWTGKDTEKEKAGVSDDSHTINWRDRLVGPAYEAGKSFKQTAMETLDGVHVGRKRITLDIDFVCQGVANEHLDRYQVSEQPSSDEDEAMVPHPLFHAKSDGKDRRSH